MTIESSGFSNRFHFDVSANFSRTVTRESSTNLLSSITQNPKVIESNNNSLYSRSRSVDLLERALSDGLGKKVDLQANNNGQSPVKAIAKNILSFVRQELRDARNSGASEQQLQGLLDQARKGIEQGFASAKEALQGRFETEPRLEKQLERAFNRIQRGLERIDNRFTPNVESINQQSQQPLATQPTQVVSQSSAGDDTVSAAQANSQSVPTKLNSKPHK